MANTDVESVSQTSSEKISSDLEVFFIGNEKRPVLVADNFLPDANALFEAAQNAPFQPFVRFFPGIQAPFPFERFDELMEPYLLVVKEIFRTPDPLVTIECGFALVSTPPADLNPLQRIPHIDTIDPNRIAILAYISGAQFGGTAFYRHRTTGYEYLDKSRIDQYNAALDDDIARSGVPSPNYISGDTELFEQIAAFEPRPGRAVIYASNSLHSGQIFNADQLSKDVAKGRLTLNAFVTSNPN